MSVSPAFMRSDETESPLTITAMYIAIHSQQPEEALMARGGGKAPKQITWVICLILYLVALLAHFGVVKVTGNVADWAWIIGFGLLLLAVQIRGL